MMSGPTASTATSSISDEVNKNNSIALQMVNVQELTGLAPVHFLSGEGHVDMLQTLLDIKKSQGIRMSITIIYT
jgi:hypothetical protein